MFFKVAFLIEVCDKSFLNYFVQRILNNETSRNENSFSAISVFVLASPAFEGCCRTKLKPVTKYTNQLIYILLYIPIDIYKAIHQSSYSLQILGLLSNSTHSFISYIFDIECGEHLVLLSFFFEAPFLYKMMTN